MSEYDFRSKCVAFECHWHGFAREVIVRDDRESTEKSKIRGAERPLGAQLVSLVSRDKAQALGYGLSHTIVSYERITIRILAQME